MKNPSTQCSIQPAGLLPVQPQCQGSGNSCGTTALSVVLNTAGIEVSREALDAKIRRMDSFTAPGLIQRAAQEYGLTAQLYNQADFRQIERHLEAGHFSIVLYQPNRLMLHYEVIERCGRDSQGKPFLVMTDASTGTMQTVPYAAFEKDWRQTSLFGVPTGYDRFLIALSKTDDLPVPEHGPPMVNGLVTALSGLLNRLA